MPPISYNDILTIALIAATGLLIIVLYNLIFLAMYARRVAERLDFLTKEVETIILKPLGIIDYAVEWLAGFVEGMREGDKHKKHKKHHKKVVEMDE